MATLQRALLPTPFPELFGCWLSRRRLTISSCQDSPRSSTETFWKLPTPSCSPARELGESSQVGGGVGGGGGQGMGRGVGSRPGLQIERETSGFLGPWLRPQTSSAWPAPPAWSRQIPTGPDKAEFSSRGLNHRHLPSRRRSRHGGSPIASCSREEPRTFPGEEPQPLLSSCHTEAGSSTHWHLVSRPGSSLFHNNNRGNVIIIIIAVRWVWTSLH